MGVALNELRKLEWSGFVSGQGNGPHGTGAGRLYPACPVCHGLKEKNREFNDTAVGHKDTCSLAETLRMIEEGKGE